MNIRICYKINSSVSNIKKFYEVNTPWNRSWLRNALSQTSIISLYVLALLAFGTRVDGATHDGICQSKDIRNLPSELKSLKGCRVIEGFLMITLIDRYNETDYDNITFPELIEITDFLMLYRVQGLKSLAHLFPNLRVIRGNKLVNNYSLIIYEMLQLTEIGLKSLTNIVRGSVRIEKNPLLCFVDTINWTYIANGTQIENHFIDSNKVSNECPVCPIGKKGDTDGNDSNGSNMDCPVSKHDPKKRYCWNRNFCQKICPDSCGTRSCDDEGNCCDDKCLGSCELNPANCIVCRKVSVGPLNNRQCVDKCPHNLFMFEQRRCISNIECWNITKPFSTPGDNIPKKPFIPFNGTCTSTCPEHYFPDGGNGRRYCKLCNGECKKECHGSTIDSIAGAQRYRGCAIISGTLIIQIRQGGQNVIKELEQSLSDIEEIEGGLKIIRSYQLISLNFFKKLKVIHGINAQENYALYVLDNQNLQSFFDKPVIIERGKIFIHFNSKLCYATIEKIKDDVRDLKGVEKFAIEDVSTYSNGNKVACNVTKLTARPSSVMNIGAIIEVEAMKYDDTRVLLGYVLRYKPAPYANVTFFDGIDVWRAEDTTTFDRRAPMVQIILSNLKPYTQYAYYVKTYTIASELYGGQTDILYFRTLPGQPGIVQKLKVLPNGYSSTIVTWEPPKLANGKLSNYIVKASLIYDDPELLQQRNYCQEPISLAKALLMPATQSKENPIEPKECQCPDEDEDDIPLMTNEKSDTVEQIIKFENEIQNIVYVKRTPVVTAQEPKDRRRRYIDAPGKYSNKSNSYQLDIEDLCQVGIVKTETVEKEKSTYDFTESKMVNDSHYEQFYDNTTKATVHTFTLTKLRHFSMYLISVQACRDFDDPQFNVNSFCSNVVMLIQRTEKNADADNIEYLDYRKVSNSNNSMSMVKLNWLEPKDPNGLIVSYTITYKRVDLDNVKPTEQCISRDLHANLSGEIPLLQLSNGNYSISVKATSLAGDGNETPPRYIEIDESRIEVTTIVFVILGMFFLGVTIYASLFILRRKFSYQICWCNTSSSR